MPSEEPPRLLPLQSTGRAPWLAPSSHQALVAVGCVVLPRLSLSALSAVFLGRQSLHPAILALRASRACPVGGRVTDVVGELRCNVPLPLGQKDRGTKGLLREGLAWPFCLGKKGAMWQAGRQPRPVVCLLPA